MPTTSKPKMEVRIEGNAGKQQTLVIRIPIEEKESTTGKTLVIASTRGNKEIEGVEYDGKNIILGLNAYIYKDKD